MAVMTRPSVPLADDRLPSTGTAALAAQRRGENFPVAMRLLPGPTRRHLVAVYDVARWIDDLADEAAGDRVALLTGAAADLEALWRGEEPASAVLRRLAPTVRTLSLPIEPFRQLVAAGLADQQVTHYETDEQLRGYCRLSADPVGRLVLAVFGQSRPVTQQLSDRVCTALQLLEHWQDVGEDRRAGRVYLPAEHLAAFGVGLDDLDQQRSSPALRRLMSFETDRAAALLHDGAPLVRHVHGWARVAVAGYVAGGLATVAALRRPETDVLVATPRPRPRSVARHAARLYVAAAR